MEWRFLIGVSVPRIPEIVREIVADRPAEFVSARLGEDLDAAESELVILRRERVLIEPDLANRFLGRKLASAETIDENGATIRSGRRSGQGLQRLGEIVRVV